MKYYFVNLGGCAELLKKRFRNRSFFDYARKTNFDALSQGGIWGRTALGATQEKAYYGFFDDEKNFPGESFARIRRMNIPVSKGQTFFLLRFMTQADGRVIDSDVNLSEKEVKDLLDNFSDGGKVFRTYIQGRETVAVFDEELPQEQVLFPGNMQGRKFADFLYKSPGCEKINLLTDCSAAVLPGYPINKVREDLGEPQANLLWFWGSGRAGEPVDISRRIEMETLHLHLFGDAIPPAGLLGFEEVKDIKDGQDNSFIWISGSLSVKDSPAVWIKRFEAFDRDALGYILEEYRQDKCRVLFVFDGFLCPDTAVKKARGAFLSAGKQSASRFRGPRRMEKAGALPGKYLLK